MPDVCFLASRSARRSSAQGRDLPVAADESSRSPLARARERMDQR